MKQKHHYVDSATRQEANVQSYNFERTIGMQQWLDQNEREWNSLDSTFRRRLINRVHSH